MLKKVLSVIIIILLGLPVFGLLVYKLLIDPCIKGYNEAGWLGVLIALMIIFFIVASVYGIVKTVFWAIENITEE